MAKAKARIKSRKRSTKKGRKRNKKFPQIDFKGILYTLFLLSILVLSIGALGYFIFFRTVTAAELQVKNKQKIIFEEPIGTATSVQQERGYADIENPKCAIIIDDMGYHREIGKGLLSLPLKLTFSFLPHAPYASELEEMAYQADRTVLLHVPLQPQDSLWDPGPGALYLNDLENQRKTFLNNLSMIPHATGVNNHMGSLYTEDRKAMESLLKLIARKKLFFIDSFTSPKSVGLDTARELGIQSAKRNLFLDNDLMVEKICKQMAELVAISKEQGSAIGIAHPNVETLQAFRSCGQTLEPMLVGVEELLQ